MEASAAQRQRCYQRQSGRSPNGKTDLSFDGQTKYNHGMLFTLNHIQKFSDKWSGFINGGYGHYSEHKNDPNSGSLTLGDNGKLSGKFRDYVSDSKSSYWQVAFLTRPPSVM